MDGQEHIPIANQKRLPFGIAASDYNLSIKIIFHMSSSIFHSF